MPEFPLLGMGGPDFAVEVVSATAARYTAAPAVEFRLRVDCASGTDVRALALRVQLRIEPQRRPYGTGEQEALWDLFGEPSRWGQTLKPFLWAELGTVVPSFCDGTEFDLVVPCSYDFEVAANRYLHGLAGGEIPLLMLFSGSVFSVDGGRLSVSPVPWHTECQYRLAVTCWREAMDRFFPGSGWLRLSRDTLDALARYKSAEALATWDEAITMLVKGSGVGG